MSWEYFTKEMTGRLYTAFQVTEEGKKKILQVINTGKQVWEEEVVLEVWKEYLQKLYETNTLDDKRNNILTEEIVIEKLQMLEIEKSALEMKKTKLLGQMTSVEMIKVAGPIPVHWLYCIMRVMWTSGKIPQDW